MISARENFKELVSHFCSFRKRELWKILSRLSADLSPYQFVYLFKYHFNKPSQTSQNWTAIHGVPRNDAKSWGTVDSIQHTKLTQESVWYNFELIFPHRNPFHRLHIVERGKLQGGHSRRRHRLRAKGAALQFHSLQPRSGSGRSAAARTGTAAGSAAWGTELIIARTESNDYSCQNDYYRL